MVVGVGVVLAVAAAAAAAAVVVLNQSQTWHGVSGIVMTSNMKQSSCR